MAKHKTLGSLGKSLIEIAERSQINIIDGVRKAALVTDQVAVVLTPVDTGFARSRWQASIGEPVASEPAAEGRVEVGEEISTAIALSQANNEIKKWKGFGSIFITNPLDYVRYLDQGSSDQAPQGMADDAVNAGLGVLKELRILD